MEILIPGLILVALMVYVSTRIKKNAAKAYDEEFVETDDFSITKPEGFILPVDENSEFAFAAFSKDFGSEEAGEIRQVSAELRIHESKTLEAVHQEIKAKSERIVSEQKLANGTQIIEAERIENGVVLESEYRLVRRNGKVFELSVAVLPETKEALSRKIDRMLTSFEVK